MKSVSGPEKSAYRNDLNYIGVIISLGDSIKSTSKIWLR